MQQFVRYFVCSALIVGFGIQQVQARDFGDDPKTKASVKRALDYLARQQRRQGYWEANQNQYRVAMTALAGMAMLCEGSTPNQGRYKKNIQRAIDYLISVSRDNGLIGNKTDYRYTYGHGFSLLFLSQVMGEEEDLERRKELKKILEKAVQFTIEAQTSRGGWGYVSAKDGNDFDEGSTCVTQVQGLRAARNAGIPVPKSVIDRAMKYIEDCMTPEGGIRYSIKQAGGGARAPITAAAVACMFNAGAFKANEKGKIETRTLQKMLAYCERSVWPGGNRGGSSGHWHYAHYYYAQAVYRLGDKKWEKYLNDVGRQIIRKQSGDGSWKEGYIGPVYTTAINATILQIGNGYLPIYQR